MKTYECEGQLDIFSMAAVPDKVKYRDRYPFPIEYEWQKEFITDKWHYCDEEEPSMEDVYDGVLVTKKTGDYLETSLAWAKGCWWVWDSWFETWYKIKDKSHFPLCWRQLPSYSKNDKYIQKQRDFNGIVTKSLWP